MRRWLTSTFGLIALLALVAAACAPAAEQKAPAPAAEKPAAQQPAAPKPAAEKPAAEKPAAEKPAVQQPAAPVKPKTSVSGIPLDPDAKVGGVLRLPYSFEGPTFSPWEETIGTGMYFGQPVTNMIVQSRTWGTEEDYNRGAYFEFHPDLAVSWEQSTDGKSWTFKLRDGVKFEDGVPFTCEDAKWTLDSIRTGKGLKRSPRGAHLRVIDRIECVDKLTMVLHLKWANLSLIDKVGLAPNMVFPKHKYENDTDSLRKKPTMGTGPFKMKEWIPGEKAVLVRKEDYWDKPFPYVDGIEYIFLSTPAIPTALRAGRIELGSYQGYQGAVAKTLIAECTTCKVYKPVTGVSYHTMYVNHQRPPWNQPLIMEALAYAVDRKKFVEVVSQGFGDPGTGGGFHPGTFWAMPPERVKQMPGWNFDDPAGNKKKARDLLAQAGYRPGELVMPLTIWKTIEYDIPFLVEEFAAVGIKVEPKAYETAKFFEVMGSADFEVGTHGFWMSGLDPDITLYEHFYTGSDRNYGRYSNPEVDRLIDLQSGTLDPQERRRIAWDAIELAWRSGAKHLLEHNIYQPIVGGRIRGYMPTINYLSGWGPMLRYQHVWLSEK